MKYAALVLLVMFIGGLVTSFAEYKIKYSLYETVSGAVGWVVGLFKKKAA